MANYSRLNPAMDGGQDLLHGTPTELSSDAAQVPHENTKNRTASHLTPLGSDDGSNQDGHAKSGEKRPGFRFWGTEKRSSPRYSIASAPWEHKLHEKHLRNVPSTTDTVRYFDRRRQTRRVFMDGLVMWSVTFIICAALAGTIYGFSTIKSGLTQTQKYAYNSLVTGLSIALGLAFAAQFKQYAEMMRWRFLTSQYRSLQHFEDVLGCDSYRSALKIMFRHGRLGSWFPSKVQVIAATWLLVFVAFNTFAALIGLTYSIDVSEIYVHLSEGNVSVAELQYIANQPQADNGQNYRLSYQAAAANLWGQLGQNLPWYTSTLDNIWAPAGGAVYTNDAADLFWARFVDLSPTNAQANVVTSRTVTSSAVCQEYTITYGGYAGFNTDNATLLTQLSWVDNYGREYTEYLTTQATGTTTWMGNTTSNCGPRCAQILALQSANNYTVSSAPPDVPAVPKPRLWACNNTVSQVANYASAAEGFDNPNALTLPDIQAQILAGAIGLNGLTVYQDDLEYVAYDGDTIFSPPGNCSADDMAWLVMKFTVGALAAMDTLGAPRVNLTGASSPSAAQVVNVQWPYAGAILTGIPALQFVMLLGVVWFSGKAIILDPSYVTTAHVLRPLLNKIDHGEGGGCLLSADELAERLGPNFRIAHGVRPDPNDPGHHDDTFVRHLEIIDERDGFGKLTHGRMPPGRYD